MSFFTALKKKIAREPDRNFDQRFWQRFDAEFSGPARSRPRAWRLLFPSMAAAAFLAIFLLPRSLHHSRQEIEPQLRAAILENEELIDDLDLLATLEDPSLNEDEWQVLLENPRDH